MRLVDADEFIDDMKRLYESEGWEPRELHFSLLDLAENLSNEPTIEIPDKDMIALLYSKLLTIDKKGEFVTDAQAYQTP